MVRGHLPHRFKDDSTLSEIDRRQLSALGSPAAHPLCFVAKGAYVLLKPAPVRSGSSR